MQDLGSAFWGFALAKAPFSCSSGSKGINTNFPELVPPRSPLKVFRAAAAFLHRGRKGAGRGVRGSSSPLVGTTAAHMVLDAHWAGKFLVVLPLWSNKLATIVSPKEFGPTLVSSYTHRRTNNFPTGDANCRVLIKEVLHVNVSEPKPNRPNIMNLVKKWAQELGLSEGFINDLTGSWGSKIVKGVEEGWMLILRLCSRMNSSSSRFFGASRSELSRVLRAAIPPSLWDLCCYISFYSIHLDHPSIDHAGRYLSTCLIQRFPQLVVSYSRQGDTVQGSFLH